MALLKRADKEHVVTELADALRNAPAVVVASFQALPVAKSSVLRRALRASGGRVRVVPKRLFRRVAENLGWPALLADTSDSIAVAWSTDLMISAKTVREFIQRSSGAAFLGGVLEGNVLSLGDVERLATLPPLETVRAQFVSVLAGPIRGLLGVCSGVLRGLPAVLAARARA